jgi:hypothetical protein
MNSNFKLWFHGLIGAVIGAAGSAVAGVLALPNTFDPFTKSGLINLARLATIPAMLSAATYLSKSPVWSETSSSTTTVTPTVVTQTDTAKKEGI